METLDVKNLVSETSSIRRRRAEPDGIDRKLDVIMRELPSLDRETEGIVDRVIALHRLFRTAHNTTLEELGTTWEDWKVLCALRYAGEPYRTSPGRLAHHLELSSGAVTARLDKMESRGLLRRLPDPEDRRGVQVEITVEGRALWEECVGVQAEKEMLVASALSEAEKLELNDLLRRLIHAFADVESGRLALRA